MTSRSVEFTSSLSCFPSPTLLTRWEQMQNNPEAAATTIGARIMFINPRTPLQMEIPDSPSQITELKPDYEMTVCSPGGTCTTITEQEDWFEQDYLLHPDDAKFVSQNIVDKDSLVSKKRKLEDSACETKGNERVRWLEQERKVKRLKLALLEPQLRSRYDLWLKKRSEVQV